ncbi:hypothetical protein LTR53_000215 [Teratosphaeriaceae sp. CCFEE 6253]|nr:hypothetical protein LTR53_000215 [Teratosphaeriaceae sp. CCFEE 6253]
MIRVGKRKQELDALQAAHSATRLELDEALQVAQYLDTKVETLRSFVAGLTIGTELKIMLPGYSEDLERMQSTVLGRAAYQTREAYYASIREAAFPAPEPPTKRQRRSGRLQHPSSDLLLNQSQDFISSDGLTIDPARIFSSDALRSSDTIPSWMNSDPPAYPDPEPVAVDLVALDQQMGHARAVMGELADTPVAQRILHQAETLTREQMERMRSTLEANVEARTNLFAFADDLLGREEKSEDEAVAEVDGKVDGTGGREW